MTAFDERLEVRQYSDAEPTVDLERQPVRCGNGAEPMRVRGT